VYVWVNLQLASCEQDSSHPQKLSDLRTLNLQRAHIGLPPERPTLSSHKQNFSKTKKYLVRSTQPKDTSINLCLGEKWQILCFFTFSSECWSLSKKLCGSFMCTEMQKKHFHMDNPPPHHSRYHFSYFQLIPCCPPSHFLFLLKSLSEETKEPTNQRPAP
jgi:hypothetical protein